jgi:sulfate adenylyltransferase
MQVTQVLTEVVTLDDRECCDVEMILNGGFSPLTGFMTEKDYNSVLDNYTLANGKLWTIPIVLRVPETPRYFLEKKHVIELKHKSGISVAKLHVEDCYYPDLDREFTAIYGCSDDNHPYIRYVNSKLSSIVNTKLCYMGGKLEKINDIPHYDFMEHRMTPAETRAYFKANGWDTVIGFQTRNPMHKSHFYLTKYALDELSNQGKNPRLMLHPIVGVTQEDDIPYSVRVKCYKDILPYYITSNGAVSASSGDGGATPESVLLNLLTLSMRMAGPREAVWHALVRQNYGCTHFVIGRDHAGPSAKKKDGTPFFGPYDAHKLFERLKKDHPEDIRIEMIKSKMIAYAVGKHLPVDVIPQDAEIMHLSGTQLRALLKRGEQVPEWFTFPEIAQRLRMYYPSVESQGFCLYLVGLSGAGKTTLSNALIERLKEITDKRITVLDGDVIREHLAPLGFSKQDRSINVRRIGYISKTVVDLGGICICANIAPYHKDREYNRKHIPNYVQIYLNTPLAVCENRDVKGLYQKARNGVIPNFTGISDPYEEPTDDECDLVLCCDDPQKMNSHLDEIVSLLRERLWIT